MNLKTIIKFVLGAFATIILGAIGSGVWEKLLSPGLTHASHAITSFISSISTSYSNSIYSRASNISYHDETAILASFLFLLVFIGLFVFALNTKKEHLFIGILHRSFVEQYKGWWGIVQSGAFLVVIFFLIVTQTSVTYIQSYTSKQMEILRPYVGEQKYHLLKSDFLQIESKEEFEGLLKKMEDLAKENDIKLGEFKNV